MFGFNEQTFVQKDGALLKLRDLHSVEGLFNTKMTKNGEECQKFREVKKALEKENFFSGYQYLIWGFITASISGFVKYLGK